MQHFLPCNGCGKQIPIPELPQGDGEPEFLDCANCGQQIAWRLETIESKSPETPQEFVLELDAKPDNSEPELTEFGDTKPQNFTPEIPQLESGESKSVEQVLDWSVLGPAIPRRRQKEVSAIRKIVPPVLGGLAAFPIATLIMWYGFGKDIGSTGPTVSQYVPWIVPQKFRARSRELPIRDFASSRSSRSTLPRPNATTQNTLPTLNRENSDEAGSESPKQTVEMPTVKVSASPSKTIEIRDGSKVGETTTELPKPALSETIAQLRTLQLGWESSPVADRTKMLQVYCASINQLSEQSSKLNGRSANVWRKELEKIAREILANTRISKAIDLGAKGGLTGILPASPDDFVATVITLGEANTPSANATWSLQEPWPSDQGDIPVEVLTGAWRAGSQSLPASCLVLGQLVNSESSESKFVLRVHLILPN